MSKLAKRAAKAAYKQATHDWKIENQAGHDGQLWLNARGRWMRGGAPASPMPKKKRPK